MELLYIWVEDYKNIHKQGFNFSSEYDIEYNFKTKKLNIGNKKNLIPKGFFGENISNVTAIIGENGMGKSTLLELIMKLNENIIAVYLIENHDLKEDKDKYKDKKFYIIHSDKKEIIKMKVNDEELFCIEAFNLEKSTGYNLENKSYNYLNKSLFNESDIIYYDNIFNAYSPFKYINGNIYEKNGFNMSTSQHFFDKNKSDKLRYASDEIKNMNILFMDETYKIISKETELRKPNEFIISNIFTDIIQEIQKSKINSIEEFNNIFIRNIIYLMFEEFKIFSGKNQEDIYYKNFEKIVKEILNNQGSTLSEEENINFKIFLEKNFQRDNGSGMTDGSRILGFMESGDHVHYKVYLNLIKKFYEIFMIEENKKNYIIKNNEIIVSFENEDFMIKINEFLKFSNKNSISKQFFNYNYDIVFSSGEIGMITLFARIFSIKGSIKSNKIFFILDEPDIYMHPEWQRKFLNILIISLQKIFPKKIIQIILTSHSPFVISDLPKDNVIFLDKDEEENCKVINPSDMPNTFAENIHNLLANSFFMSSTMGEFAKTKIQNVIKLLKDSIYYNKELNKFLKSKEEKLKPQDFKTEILNTINLIGEKLIKNKLLNMFHEKFPEYYGNEKQKINKIEKLVKEIEKWKIQNLSQENISAVKTIEENIAILKKNLVGDNND